MRPQDIISFHDPAPSPDRTRTTVSVFVAPQGVKLPELTMMGTITGTGFVTLCRPEAEDGSEVPRGLLYAAADASPNWCMGGLYVQGTFDPAEIALAPGWTVEAAAAALAEVGVTLRAKVPTHTVYRV